MFFFLLLHHLAGQLHTLGFPGNPLRELLEPCFWNEPLPEMLRALISAHIALAGLFPCKTSLLPSVGRLFGERWGQRSSFVLLDLQVIQSPPAPSQLPLAPILPTALLLQ